MVHDKIKREKVSYFKLPNNKADVFLRKDFNTYINEENETIHTWAERIIQVDQSISKKEIEDNFEEWWNYQRDDEVDLVKRVQELEKVIDTMLGVNNE